MGERARRQLLLERDIRGKMMRNIHACHFVHLHADKNNPVYAHVSSGEIGNSAFEITLENW